MEAGSTVDFEDVLMIADGDDVKLGTPMLAGTKVSAEVLDQGRHKKISIIKFRRRKHHRKQMGHRQDFTEVKITAIGGAKKKAAPKKASAAETDVKPAAKKATAAKKPAAKKPAAKKSED